MEKDKFGRIILDDYIPLKNYIMGRKQKIWLQKNGQKYLFKTGATNYEIYAELIAEKLALQCGFKTALYRYAIYNGQVGVVTPSFLKKGDIMLSMEKYINNAKEIAKQNNINLDFNENSIEVILNACALQDMNADLSTLMYDLMTIFCFDLTILEADRNQTNLSIIRDIYGNVRLAPIYDCSTMARMNTDIESLTRNLHSDNQIYNITDNIQYNLKLIDSSSANFMIEFTKFCDMFPDYAKNIMECIAKIDVDLAINQVEQEINNGLIDNPFSIPYAVKFWLRKAIMCRKNDLLSIYNRTVKKR